MKNRYKKLIVPMLVATILMGCASDKGIISEVNVSPTGLYQVDEINWSGGATAGESYLFIESSQSKDGSFYSAGDVESNKGYRIREQTLAPYGTDYRVTWDDEDSFYASWNTRKDLGCAKIDLSEDSYFCSKGCVSINDDKSFFQDYEIKDDKVYFTCELYIENTFREDLKITISAYSYEDNAKIDEKGKLLKDGKLVAVDDNGERKEFSIPADSSELVEVVFCGEKGESEEKYSRNLPGVITLDGVDF